MSSPTKANMDSSTRANMDTERLWIAESIEYDEGPYAKLQRTNAQLLNQQYAAIARMDPELVHLKMMNGVMH